MKTWGIAVIGCGTIADFHLSAVQQLENAKLIAISDRKEAKAKEIGERENCFWTTDYKQILNHPDVDIVCLTTGSGSHARIGLDVLHADKHLLVEKPLAMTVEEAEQMIQLADMKGLLLSVVSQRRFEPQHQTVKQLIDQGALGKLLYFEISCPYYRTQAYYDSASWRGTITEDGGALMNQGIHSIDLLLWFAGPVESVCGKVATQVHNMEAEDIGISIVKFRSGALGNIMASTNIQPGFLPSLHIYGEKGTIKIEGTAITHWTVSDFSKPENLEDVSVGGGGSDPRSISNEYHKLQLTDFIEALSEGRTPQITGMDGKRSIQLIHAIYEASKKGLEITLEEASE
jgi:UDP-N-acetyl-2-amino-2-deoxyglucuronate dehydrogenase